MPILAKNIFKKLLEIRIFKNGGGAQKYEMIRCSIEKNMCELSCTNILILEHGANCFKCRFKQT